MHRFLSPQSDLSTKTINITDSVEIHHLATVLRLKKGAEITIFNGQGEAVQGKIEELSAETVRITLTSPVKKSQLNPVTLTLACAIPKKTKFETIIEKCTELGIDCIIPMITERTEVRLNEERQEKKHKRYESVAANAAKQCQRNFLPIISEVKTIKEILKSLANHDAAFIPCLAGQRRNLISAFQLKPNQTNVIFLIGPEGDFTDTELKNALDAGCVPVTLGPTTLKVDTAAISSIAIARLLLEKNRE